MDEVAQNPCRLRKAGCGPGLGIRITIPEADGCDFFAAAHSQHDQVRKTLLFAQPGEAIPLSITLINSGRQFGFTLATTLRANIFTSWVSDIRPASGIQRHRRFDCIVIFKLRTLHARSLTMKHGLVVKPRVEEQWK